MEYCSPVLSKHFEPYFLPMYKKALEQLDLSEDTLLLDAGCGSGLLSSMAIEKHSGISYGLMGKYPVGRNYPSNR